MFSRHHIGIACVPAREKGRKDFPDMLDQAHATRSQLARQNTPLRDHVRSQPAHFRRQIPQAGLIRRRRVVELFRLPREPQYTLTDGREIRLETGGAKWEYKENHQSGTEALRLSETEVLDSTTPLKLDMIHTLSLYHPNIPDVQSPPT